MLEIPQELKRNLKEIGFNMAEQQIIFYLFKYGLSNIADIAKGVGLSRSTIHLGVEQLLERKVIAVTILGKRRMVYIEKPEKLRKFVEYEQSEAQKKLTNLESLLPELRTFFALGGDSEKIDVEFLEGEDGFIETFFRSLDQEKGGEVLRISGDTETFTVARDKLKGYGVARRKKKIMARHIITESPMAEDEVLESRIKGRETHVISKSILNPNLHLSIWKNHVTFTIWDEGLHSIIITNRSIYEFMKMMFEIAWSGTNKKIV